MRQPPKARNLFSSEALLRAMVPIDSVIEAFLDETADATSDERQHQFALLVQNCWNGPSNQYWKKLITRFVSRLERLGAIVDNDDLAELIVKTLLIPSDLPSKDEACYQSFRVPNENALIWFRVYPKHNDVALRLWEAGGCLAEYLIRNPDKVAGKRVVELGAGVGLTGIVAAGCCRARSVHLTDYTELALENLQHNIDANAKWISSTTGVPNVTQGYLDWQAFADMDDEQEERNSSFGISATKLAEADVMIAADVVYNAPFINSLVQTVRRFLAQDSQKAAIFASALRNKLTFDTFESCLADHGISCQYEPEGNHNLPHIFPIYGVHPRDGIRICTLRSPGELPAIARDTI